MIILGLFLQNGFRIITKLIAEKTGKKDEKVEKNIENTLKIFESHDNI